MFQEFPKQTTSTILMIRPVRFVSNTQTKSSNHFQEELAIELQESQTRALNEFDKFVEKLRSAHVNVIVVNDTAEPHTPDSIFPNNWVSFHQDGTVVLYPMEAPNRRLERRPEILDQLERDHGLAIQIVTDLSRSEADQKYLEGTGSMVLDRSAGIAYCCISPRSNKEILQRFCRALGFDFVDFDSVDEKGRAIYHTNVMMCVANKYAVVCLDSIPTKGDQDRVLHKLEVTGHEIITVSYAQMNAFAGNMLQVENTKGEKILVMSSQAHDSLSKEQIEKLEQFNPILHSDISTIETLGGGSARCMMAEVFLPSKA